MRAIFSFYEASSFNSDISKWDVSRNKNMHDMFLSASLFNSDISKWDVSSVLFMYCTFSMASSFNGDISKWDVSNVEDMYGMFFEASSFNGDISRWDVSRVQDMHGMFFEASSFDCDISTWDVSSVTDMDDMFFDALSFKQNLCGAAWIDSKASKDDMFTGSPAASTQVCALSSNAELVKAVSKCLRLSPKGDCVKGGLHGAIGAWDVSRFTNMDRVFTDEHSFNGDISNWDMSSVISMTNMFYQARSFNGNLSKWDVSSVQNMYGMFQSASSFNSDISKWDVSRVQNMYAMFRMASSFNGDISKWNVASVQNMYSMFNKAWAFNGDISEWDVSSVTNMDAMFGEAISFRQKLCGDAWVHSKASKNAMFTASRGSISRTECTSTPTPKLVTHRPLTERELKIVRASSTRPASASTLVITFTNTMTCPKCGTFKKSDRVSCCAPGGAWYTNCGGDGSRNADHRWFEGLEACKCKSKVKVMRLIDPLCIPSSDHFSLCVFEHCLCVRPTAMAVGLVCPKCGTVKKSGKMSCCGRGGSWFRKCGSFGNTHTWYEGIQICKTRSRSIAGQSNVVQHLKPGTGDAASMTDFISVVTHTTTAFTTTTPTSIATTTTTATIAAVSITTTPTVTTMSTTIIATSYNSKETAIAIDWTSRGMFFSDDACL